MSDRDHCGICGCLLDDPKDQYSMNCGGDCVYCMAYEVGDPDSMVTVSEMRHKEITKLKAELKRERACVDLTANIGTEWEDNGRWYRVEVADAVVRARETQKARKL